MRAATVLAEGVRFEIGRLRFVSPLRTAIVVGSVAAVALSQGDTRVVFPLIVGALLVGISDPQDTAPVRRRSLMTATFWFALAATLGGLVSASPLAHVVVGALVAAICGYVCVLGPRAALAGMFALVVFLAFAGAPGSPEVALRDGAMVLIGGGLQVLIVMITGLTRRDSGARAAVASAYRHLAVDGLRSRLTVPIVVAAFAQADDVAQRTVAGDGMRVWLVDLAGEARRARLGVLALAHHPMPDPVEPGIGEPGGVVEAVEELRLAAADVARQVARVLVLPWRRRGLDVRIQRLKAAQRRAASFAVLDPAVTASTVEPLIAAARAVAGPWPWSHHLATPGAAQRSMPDQPSPVPAATAAATASAPAVPLLVRLAPKALFVQHAARLAAAVAVGIVFSKLIDLPHSYWLPLTVAWVARPDLGSTLSLVTFRVMGTLAGAAVITSVLVAVDLSPLGHATLIGIGTLIACAFITVNYSVGVAGLTTILLTLLASLGEAVERDFVLRAAATITGGLLVVAVALVRPQRAGQNVAGALADVAERLRLYAGAIVGADGAGIEHGRLAVQASHAPAHVAVEAVEHEPGRYVIAAQPARKLLTNLLAVSAQLSVADLALAAPALTSSRTATVPVEDNVMTALGSLEERLRAVQHGAAVPTRTGPDIHSPIGANLNAAHDVVEGLVVR
jgi:uncharacterized membrane protein YccC